jgi:hypothetical protein
MGEKIAICFSTMSFAVPKTSQNHLINHKLTLYSPSAPANLLNPGVRDKHCLSIPRVDPIAIDHLLFPTQTRLVNDSLPFTIGKSFVETNMHHWQIKINFL